MFVIMIVDSTLHYPLYFMFASKNKKEGGTLMKIHELAQTEFASIDDITVAIAEAVTEADELNAENERLKADLDNKDKEINSLKTKNLELLAMIPTVIEDTREPEPEVEEIYKEDIYF